MTEFKSIAYFKHWCQKVLPAVYDDSLSYYELLCKVTQYLNYVIEDINAIPEYIKSLLSDDKLKEILSEVEDELRSQIALNLGDVTNAPYDINADRLIFINGKLYRTLRAMLAGDQFVENSNITSTTIEYELRRLFQGVLDITDKLREQITTDWGKVSVAPSDINHDKLVFIDGTLYRTLTNITEGDSLVSTGSTPNIVSTTIENELSRLYNGLNTAINNEIQDRQNAVGSLSTALNNEVTARVNQDRFINNRINRKKIICVGDSYLAYNASEMATESWGAFLKIYRGDTDDSDIFLSGLGGAGFIGNANKTYLDLLNEADIGELNNEDITDIVVLGGLNDSSRVLSGDRTWANVSSAMETFIGSAHTSFPNAKIHIGYIGWVAYGFSDSGVTRNALMPYILEGIRAYRNCVNSDRYGIVNYINNIEYVVPVLPTTLYKDDLIHPKATMSARIGLSLNNYLNTGYSLEEVEIQSGLLLSASGVCTSITGNTIGLYSDGKTICISGGSVGFVMNNQELSSAVSKYEVAKIPISPVRACTSRPLVIPCRCAIFPGKSGTYDCVQGLLTIEDGTVSITVFFDTSAGNYTGVTSISCWIETGVYDVLTAC